MRTREESIDVQTLRGTAVRNARRIEELKKALQLVAMRRWAQSGSEAMHNIDEELRELGVEAFHSPQSMPGGVKFLR